MFVQYLQEQGILVLTEAIKACQNAIDEYKGKLVVKEAPRAVSVMIMDVFYNSSCDNMFISPYSFIKFCFWSL